MPKDYINYHIIAGIGKSDVFISNHDSLEKLKIFYNNKRDWLFGYLSYDLKNEIEDLNSDNIDNFNADNMSFFIPEYVLLLKNDQLQIETYHSKYKCDKFVRELDFSNLLHSVVDVEFSRRVDKEVYLQTVNKIKTHIKRGDIYELNYCQEFYSNKPKILPEVIFFELNKLMQTPFSSFLKLKDKCILSVSPERFLRKKGNHILSQPIKGTKKRGINIILGYGDLTKYAVDGFGKKAIFFKDEENLKSYLRENITSKDVILIKGSRGMKMEKFKNV